MTIQTPIPLPVLPRAPLDEEALFREARRLRRRRWARGLLIAILLGAIAALMALGNSHRHHTRTGGGFGTAGILPSGPTADLTLAGPLAVARDGALYVADVARDRVLVRLDDGRFRVVAGDGHPGFSGDGGLAVDAGLSAISDLAFAPDGALYIADGGRVRVVSPDGVIRTLAGDGRAPRMVAVRGVGQVPQLIAGGTRALSAPLGSTRRLARSGTPLSIAFGASGQLYISTGSQILRLTAAGKLDPVRVRITSGPLKGIPLYDDFGPIAVDAHGDIDVSGYNGWAIWQVAPTGLAREIGYARRSGGNYAVLQPAPDGAIYGESGPAILHIEPRRLVRTFTFNTALRAQYFPMTYFAVSPTGTSYADDLAGNQGFEAHQQLRSERDGQAHLLWQEKNAAGRA